MTEWQMYKQSAGDVIHAPLKLSRPIIVFAIISYFINEGVRDHLVVRDHMVIAIIILLATLTLSGILGKMEVDYCIKWGNRRRALEAVWGEKL